MNKTGVLFSFLVVTPLSAAAPWNSEQAAHLLNRAGFGGTPAQVAYLVKMSRGAAVDYLVDYDKITHDPARPKMADPELASVNLRRRVASMDEEQRKKFGQQFRAFNEISGREMSNWWLAQMVCTPRPLQEKMTLFWHGHFTSGLREVKRARLMFNQNELYRRMAVGNYRDLILAVSRDPAMLAYLDNDKNKKQHPNENYARELLELFTLGVGHYTETDIKEAARAFTGWTIDGRNGGFAFARRLHDYGEKSFMGRTGDFDGTDIIDIILEQPAAAEHLVSRLWQFLAGTEIPFGEKRRLAAIFRDNKYEMKPLLRAMLGSDAFYDSKVMHSHVKSPVELIVGSLRALEVNPEDCTAFVAAARLMGQELFQPPNVKGWDGGLTWINTASLFNRYNLLGYIVYGTPKRPASAERRLMQAEEMMSELDPELAAMTADIMQASQLMTNQPPFDPAPLLRAAKLRKPEQVVDHFIARLLQRRIPADRRKVLLDEFKPRAGDLDPDSAQTAEAVRGLIHLIVSMPEYQLN